MSDNKSHGTLKKILFFLKFLEIRLRFVMILVITALVVGYWDNITNYYDRWQRHRTADARKGQDHKDHAADGEYEYYCPMHTFVVRNQAGNCPICGMNLVQRKKGAPVTLPEGTLARVQLSPDRVMQAGARVEPVSYRLLDNTIRSYGIVESDETKMSQIIARFPGRVEQLHANAAGIVVKKGEPLAQMYSPKYLAAAQEYLQALQAQRRLKDGSASPDMEKRAEQLAAFARQRLSLAGFTKEQLDEIVSEGDVSERVTLYSPLSGTVLEKNVLLGDSVEEGTILYKISDLSSLWVQALIPEADVASIKLGMPVEVTTVSHPNAIFYGKVDFIYPTVNPDTRSAKVRIVVENEEGLLKPGMYATTVIHAPVGSVEEISDTASSTEIAQTQPASRPAGSVSIKLPTTEPDQAKAYLDSLAAGSEYYQCPMHPEVVSDKKDDCPKCGMFLEKKSKAAAEHAGHSGNAAPTEMAASDSTEQWAEGYACPMHTNQLVDHSGTCTIDACGMPMKKWKVERVLSIPENAVIDTGTRQIVYVQSSPGVFDAREVKLGNRTSEYYPVTSGLSLGQEIVVEGSFLIDAEARLNPAASLTAKAPSSETGESSAPKHVH